MNALSPHSQRPMSFRVIPKDNGKFEWILKRGRIDIVRSAEEFATRQVAEKAIQRFTYQFRYAVKPPPIENQT